ncbi:MAG: hypothetical protein KJ048_13625 [Dehalococcoidia bacterium]|nr:hypothetical protein [Dehalococcoidia bacterium]
MTDPQNPSPVQAGREQKLPFALQKDEAVLVVCRRHWLYFTLRMVGVGAAGVLGAALAIFLVARTFGFDGMAGRITMAVIAVWALYWLVRGYFTWYRYQNDLWVVTNQRIFDSLRRHWFHHKMSSADLVDVEDINVVRHGILHTIFNFGDVRCQTAGEVPNFILSGIPNPADVLATIDAARDAARRSLRGAF